MSTVIEARVAVASRHTPAEKILKKHAGAAIVDLTSRGPEPWVRFSPFYPHGGIPVPFSPGRVGASVEGIWQGLKVFEGADVDLEVMGRTTMKSLKRTVRRFGRCLGHRRGIEGTELLGYLAARQEIYMPTYAWALEHRLGAELAALEGMARAEPLVLLDYETNESVEDLRKPLSHAGLVAAAIRERLARG